MFHVAAAFDYADAYRLERVLERCGWTDVVRIEVDGQPVYEDRQGLATDLVPALDAVRAEHLDRHTPFEVAVGRTEGSLQTVARIRSNALELQWEASVHDFELDRADGESPAEHRARVQNLLASGHLAALVEALDARWSDDIHAVADAGLHVRPTTVRGPWLQLRGTDPDDAFGALHTSYAGRRAPLETERLVLSLLLDRPDAPELPVKIDHLGELVPLPELPDLLTMLATPPPPYPPDRDEEPAA